MRSKRLLFARELATRDIISIPSVRHLARVLALPSSDISATSVPILLRRAWLDSNKETSRIWKNTLVPASRIQVVPDGGLNYLDIELENELHSALADLKSKGYYKFKSCLPTTIADKAAGMIRNERLAPEISGQKRNYDNMMTRNECLSNSVSLRFFYPDKLLFAENIISEIFQLRALQRLGSLYLNCAKPRTKRMGWLSVGRDGLTKLQQSDAAQEYHYDYDAFNFLKIFIYLSDVDESTGAHQYLPGSHLPFKVSSSELNKIPEFFRLTSHQLMKLYPNHSNITSHYGKRGTIIAEDTSGFHRGSPLLPGKCRDILVLEYMDSDFNMLFHESY